MGSIVPWYDSPLRIAACSQAQGGGGTVLYGSAQAMTLLCVLVFGRHYHPNEMPASERLALGQVCGAGCLSSYSPDCQGLGIRIEFLSWIFKGSFVPSPPECRR